jgi:hypothetical protein
MDTGDNVIVFAKSVHIVLCRLTNCKKFWVMLRLQYIKMASSDFSQTRPNLYIS